MGIATLSPLSRLRSAVEARVVSELRGFLISAFARQGQQIGGTEGRLRTAIHTAEDRLQDAIRESEARIRESNAQVLAALKAHHDAHHFVPPMGTPLPNVDLPKPDARSRPPLMGDPARPHRTGATDPRLPLGRPHP